LDKLDAKIEEQEDRVAEPPEDSKGDDMDVESEEEEEFKVRRLGAVRARKRPVKAEEEEEWFMVYLWQLLAAHAFVRYSLTWNSFILLLSFTLIDRFDRLYYVLILCIILQNVTERQNGMLLEIYKRFSALSIYYRKGKDLQGFLSSTTHMFIMIGIPPHSRMRSCTFRFL